MDCIQLSLFGKTYPEPFPATTERTSGQFWKNLPAWSNQTLLFLDLRGGGRWSKAGAIAGNGWSLAWRQLDSQYFGVAQRRKRIALILDLGGQRAGEILFERTSLSRHPDPCIPAWKEAAGLTANCPTGNDRVVAEGGRNTAYTLKIRSGCASCGNRILRLPESMGHPGTAGIWRRWHIPSTSVQRISGREPAGSACRAKNKMDCSQADTNRV